MTMTKYLLAAAIAATFSAFMPAAPASAAEYPWCAQYGGRDGGRNCGFVSFQQCQATVSGMGGFCERNQFYDPRTRR
jgi:hypothetical protein